MFHQFKSHNFEYHHQKMLYNFLMKIENYEKNHNHKKYKMFQINCV